MLVFGMGGGGGGVSTVSTLSHLPIFNLEWFSFRHFIAELAPDCVHACTDCW